MTFWQHFIRLLVRRPVPAIAALYWYLTKRKVRARNRLRRASADLSFAYDLWKSRNENHSALAVRAQAAVDGWKRKPRFSIMLHSLAGDSSEAQERSIQSLERQLYREWNVAEQAKTTKLNIDAVDGDFIIPLRAGDQLSETALYRFAEALQNHPDVVILYGDEDHIDGRGRRSRPWFKPRWNQELFLAQDYLSSAVAIESRLARRAATLGGDEVGALVLEATSLAKNAIVHVPHVLTHLASKEEPEPGRLDIVARHLSRRGATCAPGAFGTVKVEWPLPDELPLVTMIIPTKDKLQLLRPCIDSLLRRTDYPAFEMLIVDNASVDRRTLAYFDEIGANPKVRVLRYREPFNYSAINNFAARHARGSYLCLLNNDTEVVEPSWLTELMRYAVRSDVGAVGAKLLYEDGSIQHAGVVVGIGDAAGHPHRFLPAGRPGYFRMAHVPQFISAVTGACLVVEKSKFEAVGGLDEEKLAVAYNDVDLCLKLEAAGWRNVYVPHAVLLHHESKSRGNDMAPAQFGRYSRELTVLQERWKTKTYEDPLHNPNLDRYSETYVLRL